VLNNYKVKSKALTSQMLWTLATVICCFFILECSKIDPKWLNRKHFNVHVTTELTECKL